jgi:hypothetical protein
VFVLHVLSQVSGPTVPSHDGTPNQLLRHHAPDALSYLALLDWYVGFWNRGEHCSIRVDARRVDEQHNREGKQVNAANDKEFLNLMALDRLVDGVGGADCEDKEQQEEQGGVGRRVPDAEERNAHGHHGDEIRVEVVRYASVG